MFCEFHSILRFLCQWQSTIGINECKVFFIQKKHPLSFQLHGHETFTPRKVKHTRLTEHLVTSLTQKWLVANALRVHWFFWSRNLEFQLDLVLKGEGDTSTFVLNGEWHLLGNVCKEDPSVAYECLSTQSKHSRLAPLRVLLLNLFFSKHHLVPSKTSFIPSALAS